MRVHDFGQDGVIVSNKGDSPSNIRLIDCKFDSNGRQGLSWISGNGLNATQCVFSNTGSGRIFSPPGAGVDIEPEVGAIRNGLFEDCTFSNNKGCGIVADGGNSSNCTFRKCVFEAKDNWAIWVVAPNYNFINCKIYGPVVHGFNAKRNDDATKFIGCYFEDIGSSNAVSKYMIETNYASRFLIKDCKFVVNRKAVFWFVSNNKLKDEMNKLVNNQFFLNKLENPYKDFMGLILGATLQENKVFIPKSRASNKTYVQELIDHPQNINLGGNQILFR